MKTDNALKKKQKSKWIRLKYPSRPEVFEAFSIFMAYPPSARTPRTQGEFAIQNEVSPNTLSNYKKKANFWEKVKENREKLKWDIDNKVLIAKIFEDMEEKKNI